MCDTNKTIDVRLARVSRKNPLVAGELLKPSISMEPSFPASIPLKLPPRLLSLGDGEKKNVKEDIGVVTVGVGLEEEPPFSMPPNSGMTGHVADSSITGAPSASCIEDITECGTAWSIIGFILTTSHAVINAVFALTKDDIYCDFYSWVMKPFCFTAMAVSFVLKPKRTDLGYMAFLYFQYTILMLGSEVSSMGPFTSHLFLNPPLRIPSTIYTPDLQLGWR